MTQWSSSVTDRLIAPGLADFRSAEIPDLSTDFRDAEHWVADHFLNSALRGSYTDGMRQYAMAFLRRARRGFRAYHEARSETLAYLAELRPGTQSLSRYLNAVDEWEQFVLQLQMAMVLFQHMPGSEKIFEKGDGSPEFRLYSIANRVKHHGSAESDLVASLPLWLSNEGLHSPGMAITYIEASAILTDVGHFAEALRDPVSSAGQDSLTS